MLCQLLDVLPQRRGAHGPRHPRRLLGLGFPAGVGLLAAAATSYLADRQNEHSIWWGLASFGVVSWLVAEYQRWIIKAPDGLSSAKGLTRVGVRWLHRIVALVAVLGWVTLGDWCCFQYVD